MDAAFEAAGFAGWLRRISDATPHPLNAPEACASSALCWGYGWVSWRLSESNR